MRDCTQFVRRLKAGDPTAVHTYAQLSALASRGNARARSALGVISRCSVAVGVGSYEAVGAHPALGVIVPAVSGLFGLIGTVFSIAGRAADSLGKVAGTPFYWASKETVDLGKAAVHALHR